MNRTSYHHDATQKQLDLVLKLINEAFGPGSELANAHIRTVAQENAAGKITKGRASAMIERLLEIKRTGTPEAPSTPEALGHLEPGYYAENDANGDLIFFRVREGTDEGKWVGWQFVDRLSGDNSSRMGRIDPKGRYLGFNGDMLQGVRRDPVSAMRRYGREIGSCGRCGRTLTDEDSRSYGLGPTCRQKVA